MTILYILHWQDGETAFGSAAKLSQYNCLETIKSHMSGEFNKSQVPNFICCNIHMHFIFFNIKSYLNLSWFLPLSDRYRNISIICSSLVLKIYQSPLLIWNITQQYCSSSWCHYVHCTWFYRWSEFQLQYSDTATD